MSDRPTNEEIQKCMEILKRLKEQKGWFMIHEIRSIENVLQALDSVLHYPNP